MKDLNLPPFYIGQKVVLLSDKKVYTVLNNKRASCGCWCTEINHTFFYNSNIPYFSLCGKHGNINKFYHDFKGWTNSRSLRPLQEAKPPLIKLTLSKIQEVEKEQILIEN